MTVIPAITNTASTSVGAEKPLVQIAGNQQWLDSLTAGQILKGRIMRHFGGSRYAVSFSGQERIVDSTVPLSVGEILTGKVVGLVEQSVHMQVVPAAKQSDLEIPASELGQTKQEKSSNSIEGMMSRSGLQLDHLQLSHIAKASKGLDFPELAMKVGFFAARHGLPVSPQLIRTIYTKITEAHQPMALPAGEVLHTDSTPVPQPISVIEILQQYLIEYGNADNSDQEIHKHHEVDTPTKAEIESPQLQKHHSDNAGSSKNGLWDMCYAVLMNAQTGAAYQHKFKSLPIIINDKLVEFDLALFDHRNSKSLEGEVQSRSLKFSLTTEFGVVTVDANVLNNRVQLQVSASSQWLMKEFSLHQTDLANGLQEAGWLLDRVVYEAVDIPTTPAETVIDHVLEQDSLSVFV